MSTPISSELIQALEANGCHAEDWNRVHAPARLDPSRIRDVRFVGDITLGRFDGSLTGPDGVARPAGICRASLKDVSVGDNSSISNVQGWISSVDIGENVLIENVGSVVCSKSTTFGNGHEVAVLNEGGGRELKITRLTSAQVAYLTVLYRDRPDLVQRLNALADGVAAQSRRTRATIGANARILRTGELINVCVGPSATINGASSLHEGTIESAPDAPTLVGDGVIAREFVIQKGARVLDGAMVTATLVGEGTHIGRQFSSENCVFFANSEGFHSEACSVFAGPYTVTHHRSTLLIAGLFSFYNAGSGTNQSNHMYKLGPLHQGIMERGCKTGSFSYLLWPSRVGAFTAVIGKHYANFDTSDMPFSYIADEGGKSTLVPAMNFFTVGTLRDGEKWPARDRRKNADKLDQIIFDVLSPYTAQKMIRGRAALQDLAETTDKSQSAVTYNGIIIKRLLLKTCGRYYKLALDKYMGDVLVRRVEAKSPAAIRDLFQPDPEGLAGNDEWVDLCGLLCTRRRLDKLVADITSGRIPTMEALLAALQSIHEAYRADEWNWFLAHYATVVGRDPAGESGDQLASFLAAWKDASLKLLNMVQGDAQKEFEGAVRTGFGIDGGADADFDAVRGRFDDNKFVKSLKGAMGAVEKKFEQLVTLTK